MLSRAIIKAVVLAFSAAGSIAYADGNTDEISQKLTKAMPGLQIDSIKQSEVPGLYEVVSGGDVAYVTPDGVHMIQGTMFNVPQRKNLSEKTLADLRVKAMKTLDKSSLLVYPAKGKELYSVTVFTDPSCPYCHKLNDDIPKLNEMGITVKYALYSRTGNGTITARQLSEVMCSADKKAALTKFFAAPMSDSAGGDCKQTQGLERIAKVAQKVGLKGTPHVVSDSGVAMSGYESPNALLNFLKGS